MKLVPPRLFLGLLLLQAELAISLTADEANDITRSVVHVLCDLSEGRQQGGSGFVYNDSNQVVTSFHVVAAALQSNVKLHVFSTATGIDRPARVLRVLKTADLALIEVDRSLGLPCLKSSESTPSFGNELVAFGHPLFTPTVQRQTLKFDKEEALEDITPFEASKEITRLGFPRLSNSVFGLMGPLVPGHSGAPIVDSDGKVVAIGDGGLEQGAASISWAIPARELAKLLRSQDALVVDIGTLSDLGVLFAAELNSNIATTVSNGNPVISGPVTLRKTRIRTLGEMRRTSASDDPLGLFQLIQPLLAAGVSYNPDELRFDIYQDANSGMNLVLPSNVGLRLEGDTLVARSQEGNIEWLVWADQVNSPQEAQMTSVEFEQQIIARHRSIFWQMDPGWSYPTLRPAADGMYIMRKLFRGFPLNAQTNFEQNLICFETFAEKGGYLLSAAVIRLGDTQPGERPENDPLWASAILGVHLSSFSR
ncbi:MAG: trypsin-like peptidase domain-containing protein [Verrucomicrobia bacterium]|nr:trypsin-like peptidase domain-containing protein [Verrucomicrobiota bacterium]